MLQWRYLVRIRTITPVTKEMLTELIESGLAPNPVYTSYSTPPRKTGDYEIETATYSGDEILKRFSWAGDIKIIQDYMEGVSMTPPTNSLQPWEVYGFTTEAAWRTWLETFNDGIAPIGTPVTRPYIAPTEPVMITTKTPATNEMIMALVGGAFADPNQMPYIRGTYSIGGWVNSVSDLPGIFHWIETVEKDTLVHTTFNELSVDEPIADEPKTPVEEVKKIISNISPAEKIGEAISKISLTKDASAPITEKTLGGIGPTISTAPPAGEVKKNLGPIIIGIVVVVIVILLFKK